MAAAASRDQIKAGVLNTAQQAGVSAAGVQELERALGPVENAWEIGRQIVRCLEKVVPRLLEDKA